MTSEEDQKMKCWPVMHLPAANGVEALCGRRPPLACITWKTTCQDCYDEWRALRWKKAFE